MNHSNENEGNFSQRLRLILQGHKKKKTQILHMVTTHVCVTSILYMVSRLFNVSILSILMCLIVYYTYEFGSSNIKKMHALSIVYSAVSMYISCYIYDFYMNDHAIYYSFAVYFIFGLLEHYSHLAFDDGDMNLITKGKKGIDKVKGIILDVILPGPLIFLHIIIHNGE